MSRIRSVHPGLWTDERFVSVQPLARLFFMGIWNECDDQGIFEWSPLKLKMRLLPADNADAAGLLTELEAVGAVMKFTSGGKQYGAVRSFTRFQRPKKPNAVHPVTEPARAFAAGSSEPVPDELPTSGEISPQMEEGGGKKEEEVPPKPPRKRRGEGQTRIVEDWEAPKIEDLTPQAKACAEQWTAASYATVAEGFACYWRRTGKMTKDWHLTWCGWVIREHSKVMRDQKFGNDAPVPGKNGEMTEERKREVALAGAELFDRMGKHDEAAEIRRRWQPTAIGELVQQAMRH